MNDVLTFLNELGLLLTMYISLPILVVLAAFYVVYLYNSKNKEN